MQMALHAESRGSVDLTVAVVGPPGAGSLATCNLICASLCQFHDNVTIRRQSYMGLHMLFIAFMPVSPLDRLVISFLLLNVYI